MRNELILNSDGEVVDIFKFADKQLDITNADKIAESDNSKTNEIKTKYDVN